MKGVYDDPRTSLSMSASRFAGIMDRGPAHGVHVIVSANGWIQGKAEIGDQQHVHQQCRSQAADSGEDMNRNNMAVAKRAPFGQREEMVDVDDAHGEERKRSGPCRPRPGNCSMNGCYFQAALPQLRIGDRVAGVGEALEPTGRRRARKAAAGRGVGVATRVAWPRRSSGGASAAAARAGRRRSHSEVGRCRRVADFASSAHLLLGGDPERG